MQTPGEEHLKSTRLEEHYRKQFPGLNSEQVQWAVRNTLALIGIAGTNDKKSIDILTDSTRGISTLTKSIAREALRAGSAEK